MSHPLTCKHNRLAATMMAHNVSCMCDGEHVTMARVGKCVDTRTNLDATNSGALAKRMGSARSPTRRPHAGLTCHRTCRQCAPMHTHWPEDDLRSVCIVYTGRFRSPLFNKSWPSPLRISARPDGSICSSVQRRRRRRSHRLSSRRHSRRKSRLSIRQCLIVWGAPASASM